VGKAAHELRPVHDALLAHLKDRDWIGPEPPGVAFTYTPGRSGKYASQILQGFEGILQVDGYAGYNRVLDPRETTRRLSWPIAGPMPVASSLT